MARRRESRSSGEGPHPAVERALEVMARDYQQKWNIRKLAAISGLSPSRFAHVFKAATGCAPLQYLKWLRMTKARSLLERTTLSLKQVLHAAGFTDRSHFSRDFGRMYGKTPSEFRQAIVSRDCRTAPTVRYPSPPTGRPATR